MDLIIKPRQAGKTHKIIEEASKYKSYIVCINKIEVDRIAKYAHQVGIKIPYPITWNEFIDKKYYGKGIDSFMIDNLDLCVQSMTNVEIKIVSLNGKENGE